MIAYTLVINADNVAENNTARTQWIKRLVEFSAEHRVTVKLACYPPYHSKYNPVKRVFGVLENYWNGDPLETVQKALGMAEGMTYKGVHPTRILIETAHQKADATLRSQPPTTRRVTQMVRHYHVRKGAQPCHEALHDMA